MYLLEVIAFRDHHQELEVLLKRNLLWKNILSASSARPWDLESAQALCASKTGLEHKIRFAGRFETNNQYISEVYFMFLPEEHHDFLGVIDEALWVNADVLVQKIVHKPQKFSPNLLEILTTGLKHLRIEKKTAI
jgi:hypothetical protein